ncbi:MAG: PQQ-binding-like beta-propeller repeat protein [Aureliella sp.]
MKKFLLWVSLLVPILVLAAIALRRIGNPFRSTIRPEMEVALVESGTDETPNKFAVGELGWNRFRGANGTGLVDDPSIPNVWNTEENLQWSTKLTGTGSSSPVIAGGRVFLTSCTYTRESNAEISELTRYVSAFDLETGDPLWEKTIEGFLPEDPYIGNGLPEHGYATNSPVTDGQRLYVFLGKSGVHCFNLDGEPLWNRTVGTGSNPKGWGSCASLILFDDLVIVNAAEESNAIIALDGESGEEVWRADSPDLNFAFSTPALAKSDGGELELVVALVGEVWGMNPRTGKLLWYAEVPISGNISPCVIVSNELVYIYGGFRQVGSACIEVGGRGDVTSSHVKWTSKMTSYISTPVLIGDQLFWADDRARCYCQDAKTGEQVARARMPGGLGGRPIYASMINLNGNLLLQSRYDGTFIMEGNESFALVSHNKLGDKSMSNATPAAAGGRLFLRSDEYLHCVAGEPSK